jgi:hypothetical protein
MYMGKETIKQRAANFCLMRSSVLASVDVMELQTTEAYSSSELTTVKKKVLTFE